MAERPNAHDRYMIQFKPWGVGQMFKTDCAFRDGELEAAKLYVDRVVTDPKRTVKAGRVLDLDTEEIVYGPIENKELDLGLENSRDNVTCQRGMFDDDVYHELVTDNELKTGTLLHWAGASSAAQITGIDGDEITISFPASGFRPVTHSRRDLEEWIETGRITVIPG